MDVANRKKQNLSFQEWSNITSTALITIMDTKQRAGPLTAGMTHLICAWFLI